MSNFQSTPQAQAAPVVAAVINHGPEEPTIVWYGTSSPTGNGQNSSEYHILLRAWTDGTVEAKEIYHHYAGCSAIQSCGGWIVVSSPTDGMNAAADINFDEIVDGADLAMLLGKWGDAPRNPMPPSDCPLGLLNPS